MSFGSEGPFLEQPRPLRERIGELAPTSAGVRVDLSSARAIDDAERLNLGGRSIVAHKGSSPHAELEIRLERDSGKSFRLREGASITGARFDQVFVLNDAQPGEWLELLVTAAVLDVVSTPTLVRDVRASVHDSPEAVTVGDAAIVEVLPVDRTRRRAVIQADRSNLGAVVLGGSAQESTLDVTNGFGELEAGDSFEVHGTDAVYAIATVAAQVLRLWVESGS